MPRFRGHKKMFLSLLWGRLDVHVYFPCPTSYPKDKLRWVERWWKRDREKTPCILFLVKLLWAVVITGILSCLRDGGLLGGRSPQAQELFSPGFTEFEAFRGTKERWAYAKDYSPNTCFKELVFIHRFLWEDTNPFSKNNTMTFSFLCSGKAIMPCYHQQIRCSFSNIPLPL